MFYFMLCIIMKLSLFRMNNLTKPITVVDRDGVRNFVIIYFNPDFR